MEEVPRFIRLRGCINCPVSEKHERETGFDYGFHSETVILCVLDKCVEYCHNLSHPFIDPEDVMNLARRKGNEKHLENARKYLLHIKEIYGHFYERIGVNLNQFLEG